MVSHLKLYILQIEMLPGWRIWHDSVIPLKIKISAGHDRTHVLD